MRGRSGYWRAYARAISSDPDDLALRLEQLFDERPPGDATAAADEEAAGDDEVEADEPVPTPTVAEEIQAELFREMDLLRDQLEAAFAELVDKVERVELRLVALRQTADAQSEAGWRIDERSDTTLGLVRELVATLDAAVTASREPLAEEPVAVDLGPIADRLGHLDAAVAATHRELVRIHDAPLPVDTRRLEDVASRGSLHNAADIANLRQDIEALTEAVRVQDKGLGELRTTLDWIKDRLLLR